MTAAQVVVALAWIVLILVVAWPRSTWLRRATGETVHAVRRFRCALRPGWHPGFRRVELTTRPISAGSYSLGVPHAWPGASPRVWTVPTCVDCDEPEVW